MEVQELVIVTWQEIPRRRDSERGSVRVEGRSHVGSVFGLLLWFKGRVYSIVQLS